MNWPEATLGMVAIVSTLIYLGCTSWYWFNNEGGYPSGTTPTDEIAPPPAALRPSPRLPDPYRP